MQDPKALTLQLRLTDRFGDNGMIAAVIALEDPMDRAVLHIDTWLMSCRVLGRQVEAATMNLLAGLAVKRGASRLIGTYRPTAKNGMVREHYSRLGFEEVVARDDESRWVLDLTTFKPVDTYIKIEGESR
jgi:FkbH-like protein